MNTKIIALILLVLFLFFPSTTLALAAESKMMAMPYQLCLDQNGFERGFNKPFTEENIRTCLMTAYPYTVSECKSLPANLIPEFQEQCFLKVHACENISSPQLKQQCESEKASIAARNSINFMWSGACWLIPLIMLALVAFAGIQMIRKKITKKQAILVIIAIIVLFMILGFLVSNAPCNVCGTICMY
jgi:hypothetical protein